MSKTLRQRIFEDTGCDMLSPISIARDRRLRALHEAYLKAKGTPEEAVAYRFEVHHGVSSDFVHVLDLAFMPKQVDCVAVGVVGFRPLVLLNFGKVLGGGIKEASAFSGDSRRPLDDGDAKRLCFQGRFFAPHRIQCGCCIVSHGFGPAIAVPVVAKVIAERSLDCHFLSANDGDSTLDFSVGGKCRTHEGIIAVAGLDLHSDLQLDLVHVLFLPNSTERKEKAPGLLLRIWQSARKNGNSAPENGNRFSQIYGSIGFLKVW
jgi:hypothetical protein